MPIRVFHGDDSPPYRLLISKLLPDGEIAVVGGAGSPKALLEGVERERPDVVLLDQLGGPDLVDRLRAAAPGVRVVALSGYPPGFGDHDLEACVDAYVTKSAEAEALRAAVRGA